MNRKRILHIITGLDIGGAEKTLLKLCKHENKYEHVIIALTQGGALVSDFESMGIDVTCIDFKSRNIIINVYELVSAIRSYSPSVVQTWMYHANVIGGFAALLAGNYCISWNLRATGVSRRKSSASASIAYILNIFLSYIIPKKIVACGYNVADWHIKRGFRRKIIKVISNGYSSPSICGHQDTASVLPCKSLDKVSIALVGRLDPQKNHNMLILALQNAPIPCDVDLFFIGPNIPSLKNIEIHVDSINRKIRLFKIGSVSKITDWYNNIDLVVQTSNYGEGFPNVMAEAMLSGCVCLGSDIGDTALILNDPEYIFKPDDIEALTRAISRSLKMFLYQRNDWEKKCISNRSQILEKYGIQEFCNNYRIVWNNCLNE